MYDFSTSWQRTSYEKEHDRILLEIRSPNYFNNLNENDVKNLLNSIFALADAAFEDAKIMTSNYGKAHVERLAQSIMKSASNIIIDVARLYYGRQMFSINENSLNEFVQLYVNHCQKKRIVPQELNTQIIALKSKSPSASTKAAAIPTTSDSGAAQSAARSSTINAARATPAVKPGLLDWLSNLGKNTRPTSPVNNAPLYDFLFRINVCGDADADKMALIRHYDDDPSNLTNNKDIDQFEVVNTIKTIAGKQIQNQLWYFPFFPEHELMGRFRGAHGVAICLDSTLELDHAKIAKYISAAIKRSWETSAIFIILTKTGAEQKITEDMLKNYKSDSGIAGIFSVNTKTGEGVQAVFSQMNSHILHQLEKSAASSHAAKAAYSL